MRERSRKRIDRPRISLCFIRATGVAWQPPSILYPVAMQVVAGGVEPGLGAFDMAANPVDHAPESRRMVHLDQMRHFMRGEIVQHEGWSEDQPPGERQRASGSARTPAAPLIADRQAL